MSLHCPESRLSGGLRVARSTTLVLLVLATAGLPAEADVLVTKDGQKIETDGPWEIKGRQVIFTTPKTGTLSAVRLSEIDLEASELATNTPPLIELKAPDRPPRLGEMSQKDRPDPTFVMTDDDVGKATTKELEALARAFGGAMMEVLEKTAETLTEDGTISSDEKREFDREIEEKDRLIRQGYEEALYALADIVKRYPSLESLEPSDPVSVRENAVALSSGARELRVAALQSQVETAAILLNQMADQFEAVAATSDV